MRDNNAAAPKAEPVSDPEDIETLISDAIGDSMDMDLTSRDGARAVMRTLAEEGLLVAVKPEAPKVEQEPCGYVDPFVLSWMKSGRYTDATIYPTCGKVSNVAIYTHSAPASDELLEALEEARTTISMLKRNVVNEINNHDGFFRWEGVPDALQARIDAINTTLAQHKGPQS